MKAKELTKLASEWLCDTYPNSIVVEELSIADWGGLSLDVAAITETHIVGVEVKGEGDSPTRLERQGITYPLTAKEMWLIPDVSIEKGCRSKKPQGWGMLELWEDKIRPRNRATKEGAKIETKYGYTFERLRDDRKYDPESPRIGGNLCSGTILGTLWRDELHNICKRYKFPVSRGAYAHVLRDTIFNCLPTPVIHDEMICELRNRTWKKSVIDNRDPKSLPKTYKQASML